MKPKHQRLIFVSLSVLFLCAAGLFSMQAFRANLVFFYSPSDIAAQTVDSTKRIRIGGLVKAGSVKRKGDQVRFITSDGKAELQVTYKGILPNLFREGQGVIAEGYLQSTNQFAADKILAKHDEKYMPKEVVDALKRSGNWHGGEQ